MGIAENIKQRRLELGLSQQELADKMGYKTRSTIAKIESGNNSVPASKIGKFASVLDTTVDYIRNGYLHADSANVTTYTGPSINPDGISSLNEDIKETKTIALILAGGKSTRNMQNIPNQFVNVLGKPVIIHAMKAYQSHPAIDEIIVVCLHGWEDILRAYASQYSISKLTDIIEAGDTGILSVKRGIDHLSGRCIDSDTIVLQESTRPLITEEIISKLLHTCQESAVVCERMDDYIQFIDEDEQQIYVDRLKLVTLQSPEAYRFGILQSAFDLAEKRDHTFNETCCAMMMYNLGFHLKFCEGNHNNIKIVRQEDIAVLSALLKSRRDLI